jgi:hypothetical protein
VHAECLAFGARYVTYQSSLLRVDVTCVLLSCLSRLSLALTGVAIVFSVLFTKTWRINKVLLGRKRIGKNEGRAQDVILPMSLFLSLNVGILAAWTAAAPLTWKEQLYKDGEPGPFRGTCYQLDRATDSMFEAKIAFASVLIAINVVALILTNYQFWRARRLPNQFNETYYIGITNVVLFECVFAGVPFLIAFRDDATIFVIVRCAIESLTCLGILLPMFLPKLINSQRNATARPNVNRTPTIIWSSVSEFVNGRLRFRAPPEQEPQAGLRVSGLNCRPTFQPRPRPRPRPVSEDDSGAFGVVRVVSRFENNRETNVEGEVDERLEPIAEYNGAIDDVSSVSLGPITE